MTVREIFALRKQGHIEEAYEAIRPMYRVHNGHYTSLCMYLCARDIFNIRLTEGRIAEATKIYQALQRLVPFIEDKDGKVTAFMQYASSRLDGLKAINKATTDLTDKTDNNSCDPCDSCSSKENPCHPSDSCSSKLSRLLSVVKGEMSVREMMAAMGFASRDKFLKNYLSPALKAGLIEMTEPNSPKSPKQRYRRAKGDM